MKVYLVSRSDEFDDHNYATTDIDNAYNKFDEWKKINRECTELVQCGDMSHFETDVCIYERDITNDDNPVELLLSAYNDCLNDVFTKIIKSWEW